MLHWPDVTVLFLVELPRRTSTNGDYFPHPSCSLCALGWGCVYRGVRTLFIAFWSWSSEVMCIGCTNSYSFQSLSYRYRILYANICAATVIDSCGSTL